MLGGLASINDANTDPPGGLVTRKILASLGFLAMTPLAMAVPCFAVPAGVTQADKDACTPDVFRLCSAYIPDEAPILACLQSHKTDLSPECVPVIFPPGETSRHHRRASR